MGDVSHYAGWFVVQLPFVVVGVTGIALVASRRPELRGRSAGLAITGSMVLLAGVVAFMGWVIGIDWMLRAEWVAIDNFDLINKGLGFVVSLVQAAGVTLLVAAVLAGRARREAYAEPAAWSPPAESDIRG